MNACLVLAPLRGVTIRCFRNVFADAIREAGFTAAIAPFIPANPGLRPQSSCFNEIRPPTGRAVSPLTAGCAAGCLPLIPQFIGKDPEALRVAIRAAKDLGYARVDLNAGCPFPMVRNKGRGAGLLQHPETLLRLLDVGCEELGPGRFSLKTRLGVTQTDEFLKLADRIATYPLAALTLHARTARQMYEGTPDRAAFAAVAARWPKTIPLVYNGDAAVPTAPTATPLMVGRAFVRSLALRPDTPVLLARYIEESRRELSGEAPVLGRIKELLAYWKDAAPQYRRRWPILKISRALAELTRALPGIGESPGHPF